MTPGGPANETGCSARRGRPAGSAASVRFPLLRRGAKPKWEIRAPAATEGDAYLALDEDVVRRYGRLDVIYNNMGLMDRSDHSALDTSLETWRRVHDANLTSIFLCCKHGIPHLRNTEPSGGSVINSASFLAAIGSATAPMAYAAAKAGVVQLTRDLGVQLARSGVRVNAVLFGPIETPDQRAVFDSNPGALEKRLVHWPMGRFGTLEEAAGAIAFLASDDSGFITAAALPLDGGITEAFTVPE
jgi:NAD(P)-dependent dehydrogenase (short-subunit alcohol dehydrogenase family)